MEVLENATSGGFRILVLVPGVWGSASFGIGLQPSVGRVGVSAVLLSFSSLSRDDHHSFSAQA